MRKINIDLNREGIEREKRGDIDNRESKNCAKVIENERKIIKKESKRM